MVSNFSQGLKFVRIISTGIFGFYREWERLIWYNTREYGIEILSGTTDIIKRAYLNISEVVLLVSRSVNIMFDAKKILSGGELDQRI